MIEQIILSGMNTLMDKKKKWQELFNSLPEEELDKIALLRVIECSNGVIQYKYRDGEETALPIQETKKAMNYSMGCMKTMSIPLKSKTITFLPETENILREVRKIYISGAKNGNKEDWEEFLIASAANINAAGKHRIMKAQKIANEEIDAIAPEHIQWGINYINKFVGWE